MSDYRDDGKPVLIIYGSDLPASAYALRDLLSEQEVVFDRGRVVVRLITDASTMLYAQPMTVSNVVMAAHDYCQPAKLDQDGDQTPMTLPDKVARMYLEMGEWGLRPLAGITTAPLIRADGGIVSEQGYDPDSQQYCVTPPLVEVPEQPSEQAARRALFKLRHAFRTFPFADAKMVKEGEIEVVDLAQPPGVDESSAMAAVLTAVARPSLWLAPGVLITAPFYSGSGSGKGLLARGIAAIAYSVPPAAFTAGHDAAEFDKRLVAELLQGNSMVFVDNVNNRQLSSEMLASALTERPSKTRELGHSKMLVINSAAFLVLTGNALKVTEDLARRFFRVDIDPKMEDPETRRFAPGFLDGIAAKRIELLQAALTILRFGRINADLLPRGLPMGNFEQWGAWVRDPLLALGCRDPAEAVQIAKQADPRRRELVELFTCWHECHADDPVAVRDLDPEVLKLINPQNRTRQWVARAVEALVDTRIAGFVLNRSKAARWSSATYALASANAEDHNGADHGSAEGHGTGIGSHGAVIGSKSPLKDKEKPYDPYDSDAFLVPSRAIKDADLEAESPETEAAPLQAEKHRGHRGHRVWPEKALPADTTDTQLTNWRDKVRYCVLRDKEHAIAAASAEGVDISDPGEDYDDFDFRDDNQPDW